jgi:hypothetical protein
MFHDLLHAETPRRRSAQAGEPSDRDLDIDVNVFLDAETVDLDAELAVGRQLDRLQEPIFRTPHRVSIWTSRLPRTT